MAMTSAERQRRYRDRKQGKHVPLEKPGRKPLTAEQAQMRVAQAIEDGVLVRAESCELCGEPGKVDAHHDDYQSPLAVRWLCRTCHSHHHLSLKERLGLRELEAHVNNLERRVRAVEDEVAARAANGMVPGLHPGGPSGAERPGPPHSLASVAMNPAMQGLMQSIPPRPIQPPVQGPPPMFVLPYDEYEAA